MGGYGMWVSTPQDSHLILAARRRSSNSSTISFFDPQLGQEPSALDRDGFFRLGLAGGRELIAGYPARPSSRGFAGGYSPVPVV
jgi:hypothetical protein